jgi:hypothetical protein
VKIAILTPYLQQVEALFTKSLADMVFASARANWSWNIQVAMQQSSNLPQGRTLLARNAMNAGADWALWVDGDMVFPPDTLARLIGSGKEVIGANYPRRSRPTTPTAWKAGNYVYTTPEKVKAGEIEAVDHLGLGVCLISGSALRSISFPIFGIEASSDGLTFAGEDVFFFRKL